MKKLITYAGLIGLATAASAPVMAQDGNWYLGASAAQYYLDSDRDLMGGDIESTVVGPQVGFLREDGIGFELGYLTDVGGDDLESISLSLIKMIGEADGFRPFITAGLSNYELDDSDIALEDEDTTQMHFGVGLSNMLNTNWELRGDVRALYEFSDNNFDGAFTLAVNYHFADAEPAAEPAPQPVAAKPAPEPEKRTITVRLNVEFEFDKDIVRAIYGDELEAVANAMKAHEDIELVLEGHTDSRGKEDYNQDLSDRRAKAVKAKLTEVYGIPASRISTVGYGESRPIADNATDEGRARNRRVIGEMSYTEIVVE
jgi:OOP family OmpA-OmpF porin